MAGKQALKEILEMRIAVMGEILVAQIEKDCSPGNWVDIIIAVRVCCSELMFTALFCIS